MNKTAIVISDTHYGVKQNSLIWLNTQLSFIYDELIPYIRTIKGPKSLFHCGDVFDSRSSINPYVAMHVRKMFIDLSKEVDEIIIIAGNHDYYSPTDDSVTSVEMILSDISNVHIVARGIYDDGDGNAFIPWFEWFDAANIHKHITEHSTRAVFCHADLPAVDDEHIKALSTVKCFSGHIHTPQTKNNMLTLGSTYALTFADANADRGFYVIHNDYKVDFIAARKIIHFYRFRNDDIFKIDFNEIKNDYIELYVDKAKLLDEQYTARLKQVSSIAHNINVVPNDENTISESAVDFTSYDIESICRNNIPDSLKEKFEQIINEIRDEQL